jgi:hypothetical protein
VNPPVGTACNAKFTSEPLTIVAVQSRGTSEYLVPAIKRLPGLIHFYAGVSPEGSAVQVSVWDTVEHVTQLDHLKEMTVDARGEAEAVGAAFTPIVNYPVGWTI